MPIERSEFTKMIIVVRLNEPIILTLHSDADQIVHLTATALLLNLMHRFYEEHGNILVGKKVIVVAAKRKTVFLAKLNRRVVLGLYFDHDPRQFLFTRPADD